jgi:hypothetical protein
MRSVPTIPWPVVVLAGIVAASLLGLVALGESATALIAAIVAAALAVLGGINAMDRRNEQRSQVQQAQSATIATQVNGNNQRLTDDLKAAHERSLAEAQAARKELRSAHELALNEAQAAREELRAAMALVTQLAIAAPAGTVVDVPMALTSPPPMDYATIPMQGGRVEV